MVWCSSDSQLNGWQAGLGSRDYDDAGYGSAYVMTPWFIATADSTWLNAGFSIQNRYAKTRLGAGGGKGPGSFSGWHAYVHVWKWTWWLKKPWKEVRVSLSRPVDECTCAVTPEMQCEQNRE